MRSIGFGPLVLCCSFVLHCVAYVRRRLKTYGHEDYHCNTKWRRKWHNCNTILVASNFSCVLPVHFFVVQNCVAVVLLRSILCCRTFHLGSVLVLPSPVTSKHFLYLPLCSATLTLSEHEVFFQVSLAVLFWHRMERKIELARHNPNPHRPQPRPLRTQGY